MTHERDMHRMHVLVERITDTHWPANRANDPLAGCFADAWELALKVKECPFFAIPQPPVEESVEEPWICFVYQDLTGMIFFHAGPLTGPNNVLTRIKPKWTKRLWLFWSNSSADEFVSSEVWR